MVSGYSVLDVTPATFIASELAGGLPDSMAMFGEGGSLRRTESDAPPADLDCLSELMADNAGALDGFGAGLSQDLVGLGSGGVYGARTDLAKTQDWNLLPEEIGVIATSSQGLQPRASFEELLVGARGGEAEPPSPRAKQAPAASIMEQFPRGYFHAEALGSSEQHLQESMQQPGQLHGLPPATPASPLPVVAGASSRRANGRLDELVEPVSIVAESSRPARQDRGALPPVSQRGVSQLTSPTSNAAKRAAPVEGGPKKKRRAADPAAAAAARAFAADLKQGMKATDHWVDPQTGRKFRRGCLECGLLKTPQWRMGPLGPKTLCNACGIRHRTAAALAAAEEAASAAANAGGVAADGAIVEGSGAVGGYPLWGSGGASGGFPLPL